MWPPCAARAATADRNVAQLGEYMRRCAAYVADSVTLRCVQAIARDRSFQPPCTFLYTNERGWAHSTFNMQHGTANLFSQVAQVTWVAGTARAVHSGCCAFGVSVVYGSPRVYVVQLNSGARCAD